MNIELDKIKESLEKVGVKSEYTNIDKYGFSREISFKIYGQIFTIEWWKNQSYLHIGIGNRRPVLPFRYLIYDNTYPLINGNKSLAFCDEMTRDLLGNEKHPFASFRIPLEIETKE